MRCAEIMSQTVVTCPENATLRDCASVMRDKNIGFLPIVDEEEHVVGVVTDRDIVIRAIASGKDGRTTVATVMTRDVVTCDPDDTIEEVMQAMTSGRFRHLPVVRRGELLGLISIGDVVKARLEETVHEAEALKAYIVAG